MVFSQASDFVDEKTKKAIIATRVFSFENI